MAYHDAAQFYWGHVNSFLEYASVMSADSRPVILPRHLVQDINTPEDWKRAELMFAALLSMEDEKILQ
ncbi:hypothetical protein [Desulfonatronospira sp.]|uniref:hypothetical protein n=1 Tax=Desulfonatronospira sp. TaxID=1962951 RepID=UPI0025BFAB76|nr:hypothetical protein [Desulfonatronospira sp.]